MTNKNNPGYAFTLNEQPLISDQRHLTGAQFRQQYHVPPDDALFLDIEGRDDEIPDSESIDLAPDEIECFYTLPRHPVHHLRINGKPFDWKERFITGSQLRELGGVPDGEKIMYSIQGEDEVVADNRRIDLGRLGVEEFYSVPDKPEGCVILTIETPKGKWHKHPFPVKTTIAELIKMVVEKFHFASDGNYQIKVKGGETLEPGRTLESYKFKDCTILCFTDLGKGA